MVIEEVFSKVKGYMQRRHGVMPLSVAIPDLEDWLDKPFGQTLLEQQQASLDKALNCLFGYHLMQLSVSRKLNLTAASTINHRFSLNPVAALPATGEKSTSSQQKNEQISGQAAFDNLPLPAESIDVAVLHHVLEYSQSPHQLLREVSRVIIPRGHLIIVGFNPWSLIGAYKPFAQVLSCKPQWRYHSLRLGRVLDWLRLLDFEPVSIEHGFLRPHLANTSMLKRLNFLDKLGKGLYLAKGSYYCIVARKEIVAMTPTRPVWGKLTPIVSLAASKPSARLPDPARFQTMDSTQDEPLRR